MLWTVCMTYEYKDLFTDIAAT